MSDVQMGVFLSGIDSSTNVALMNELSKSNKYLHCGV